MDYLEAPKYSSSAISRILLGGDKEENNFFSASSITRRIGATIEKRRRSLHINSSETLVKTPYSQTSVCNDSSSHLPQKQLSSKPSHKEPDTRKSRRTRKTKQNGSF
ncbi:hypothetical protein ElyMa_004018900 [Elysia marginata]|uniref:Uncharacterized protein n=1 Tax=Elysia marginata TaxID=1093978 RepID=A0AAV4G2E1_9GAST|nr:hypothetical protein ElyMa_004018900 [Elysia marginata]